MLRANSLSHAVTLAGTPDRCIGVLRGPWGLALFSLVWALALAGVGFKVIGGPAAHPKLSTAVYLGMGWVFLVTAGPVWRLMPPARPTAWAWSSSAPSACATRISSGTCSCWPARSVILLPCCATPAKEVVTLLRLCAGMLNVFDRHF